MKINFNQPFFIGGELRYIAEAVANAQLAGDGPFTRRCHRLIESKFAIGRALLAHSGTAALEMAALLCDLEPGDEVIVPSYTFVSTASAFVMRGARIVFCDIRPDTFNLDETQLESRITPRTRVVVPVHYAGVGCAMDAIREIARRHELMVVEDAAQGVGATWRGRPLGGIGDLGCYSFHETKNIICGEGGALCVNRPELAARAEIIREKGTNRSQFFRGEVDKYTWVGLGSSFLPSELTAAYLCAQLEEAERIIDTRRGHWQFYFDALAEGAAAGRYRLPVIPPECSNNAGMFYLLMPDAASRAALLEHLRAAGIQAVFHYVPLHTSPFGTRYGFAPGSLPVTERVADCIIRLPLFFAMTRDQQAEVVKSIADWAAAAERR